MQRKAAQLQAPPPPPHRVSALRQHHRYTRLCMKSASPCPWWRRAQDSGGRRGERRRCVPASSQRAGATATAASEAIGVTLRWKSLGWAWHRSYRALALDEEPGPWSRGENGLHILLDREPHDPEHLAHACTLPRGQRSRTVRKADTQAEACPQPLPQLGVGLGALAPARGAQLSGWLGQHCDLKCTGKQRYR